MDEEKQGVCLSTKGGSSWLVSERESDAADTEVE